MKLPGQEATLCHTPGINYIAYFRGTSMLFPILDRDFRPARFHHSWGWRFAAMRFCLGVLCGVHVLAASNFGDWV